MACSQYASPYSTLLYLLQKEGSSINIWITQCLNLHACVSFNSIFSPPPNAQSFQTPDLQKTATACECKWLQRGVKFNVNLPVLWFPMHRNGTNGMCFGTKRYTTTSLRSICLNDLYCHQNLWELTVEGDIHGLCKWVPRMPNERTTSWGKWGVALLPALSGKAVADLREGIRLPGFYFAEETEPKNAGLILFLWSYYSGRLSKASLQRVSQCSVFIYHPLPWKQSSGHWVCDPGHTQFISDKMSGAAVKYTRMRTNQRVVPPAEAGLICARRTITACRFSSALRRSWVLYFLHDKLSYWACLNAAPSQEGGFRDICYKQHLYYTSTPPLKIVLLMWKNTLKRGDS